MEWMRLIEIRFSTPGKEKLEMLNQYAEQELLEPINWGNFVYIELPKNKLGKFKKFAAKNGIAKTGEIEEVISCNIPVNPSDKVVLFLGYAEEHEIDFTLSAYSKLPKKNFDEFIKFLTDNGISDE
jgi:hypothetical protein